MPTLHPSRPRKPLEGFQGQFAEVGKEAEGSFPADSDGSLSGVRLVLAMVESRQVLGHRTGLPFRRQSGAHSFILNPPHPGPSTTAPIVRTS